MENMDISSIRASNLLKRGKTSSVRRCLFGPVDHEENSRFLKQQLKIQEQESCSKWNFDFTSMTPLDGKYAWEPVAEGEIPSAYELKHLTKPTATRARTPLGLSSRLNANLVPLPRSTDTVETCVSVNILRETTAAETCSNVSPSQESKISALKTGETLPSIPQRSPAKRKLCQSDITDFFQVKKHRSAFHEIVPSKSVSSTTSPTQPSVSAD